MNLETFISQDSTYKEIHGKFKAQRENTDALLAKAQGSSDKADIEAFQAADRELSDTVKLLEGQKAKLRRDFEDANAALEASNKIAIDGGPRGEKPARTILEAIENDPQIKAIPMTQFGSISAINWGSAEGRRNIQFQLGSGTFNAIRALRESGMMAAGEIDTTSSASPYQIVNITSPYPQYPSRLLEILPMFPATGKTVTYRKETAKTNNAAATAEKATPTASTFTIELVTDTAKMVKGKFRVTEEELMDRADSLPFIVFEANRDLRRTAAHQILQGDNTGDNWNGIYTQAGATFTKGTSSPTTDNNGAAITTIDAIGYAIADREINAECMIDLGIMHPNQFMPIILLKNQIGDYIYGRPDQQRNEIIIHGVRFVKEIEAIDGQALIGDFGTYYSLGINQGITVEINTSSDDFEKWMRTVRFSIRGLNQVRRTSAFGIIAGL